MTAEGLGGSVDVRHVPHAARPTQGDDSASGSRRPGTIYRARHEVYATELGQHLENAEGRLTDNLDESNSYIVATVDGELAGFVSITPPGVAGYSIDKYFRREDLPFEFDDGLYEVRILTVRGPHRGREVAPLLTYAAFRGACPEGVPGWWP